MVYINVFWKKINLCVFVEDRLCANKKLICARILTTEDSRCAIPLSSDFKILDGLPEKVLASKSRNLNASTAPCLPSNKILSSKCSRCVFLDISIVYRMDQIYRPSSERGMTYLS